MAKKMKVILLLTHIAVLGIGFVEGIFSPFVKLMREGVMMTTQGGIISHYASLVDVARNEGNRDAYKKSLLAFLAVLEEINKQPSKVFDTKTTSIDKVLVYERLSRLEREAGNSKAADDYMNLAVQTCGKSGLKDCSNEKITTISKKMEEKSMFSPKSKEGSTKQ